MSKMEINSKKDMAKYGLSMIMGGGVLCLFIVTAIIGLPMILLGILMLMAAPFYKKKGN